MKPIILLFCEVTYIFSFILGQIGSTPYGDWVPGVGTISATAVLAWYIWYDVTKTRPQQQKTLETITNTYRDGLNEQRLHYEKLLSAQAEHHRKEFTESLKQVAASFGGKS